MNRAAAYDIIFQFESTATQLERLRGLFDAISRLIDTGQANDLTTALVLARLGSDQTDLAESEARAAGMDAERELQAIIQKDAMTWNGHANSIAERVLEEEPA